MWRNFQYVRPDNLEAALSFLQQHGPGATLLAGGTDVTVDLRSRTRRPDYVLDISRLPELQQIELRNDGLHIGAAVTIDRLYRSQTVTAFAPALHRATLTFASQQIRNVATIGGNVAHCAPCGDTLPPLLLHDTRVLIAGRGAVRTLALGELASAAYCSSLAPHELITGFVLAPLAQTFADFQKIGRRQALAIARISMAASGRQAQGRLWNVRLALGACTPIPRRVTAVEQFLEGSIPDIAMLWQAGRLLADEMIRITGRRSSTIYKEKAVQGLLVRLLYPLIPSPAENFTGQSNPANPANPANLDAQFEHAPEHATAEPC